MEATIVVLAGDGIGPEVTGEAQKVMEVVAEKYGHQFHFSAQLMGGRAIDELGTSLPDETVEACRRADAVLLGAVGGRNGINPNAADRPGAALLSPFAKNCASSPTCVR